MKTLNDLRNSLKKLKPSWEAVQLWLIQLSDQSWLMMQWVAVILLSIGLVLLWTSESLN